MTRSIRVYPQTIMFYQPYQLQKMPSLPSTICHLGKSLQEHHISLKDICRSLRNDKAQQLVVAHK